SPAHTILPVVQRGLHSSEIPVREIKLRRRWWLSHATGFSGVAAAHRQRRCSGPKQPQNLYGPMVSGTTPPRRRGDTPSVPARPRPIVSATDDQGVLCSCRARYSRASVIVLGLVRRQRVARLSNR